jgi:ClpX C4-type zinc finger
MAEWRKNLSVDCPACGKRGGQQSTHKDCPQIGRRKQLFSKKEEGHLWIDIETGTVRCESCEDTWSLEKTISYCPCGVTREGGAIWMGIATEIGKYENLVWMQKLGIRKGSLETRVTGYWKWSCCFCRESSESDNVRRIFPVSKTSRTAICNNCLDESRHKLIGAILWNKSNAVCNFCQKSGSEVQKIIRKNNHAICNKCMKSYRDEWNQELGWKKFFS